MTNKQQIIAKTSFYNGPERVFLAKRNIGMRATLTTIVGLILLAMSILWITHDVNNLGKPDHRIEPVLNVGFISFICGSVFSVFSFIQAYYWLGMTRRVTLNTWGLQIETFLKKRRLQWTDISEITYETRSADIQKTAIKVLVIRDATGRQRAMITETLQDLEALVQELVMHSSAGVGHPTYDAARSEKYSQTKEARQLRWGAGVFLFFSLATAGTLIAGIYEEVHIRRLAKEGVRVEAEVVRTWVGNTTPHLEYTFKDAGGVVITREAMMLKGSEWKRVQASKTVAVLYLPDAPGWSRLVSGETGPAFGGNFLFVSIGGLLMFGTFFILAAKGFNFKKENGMNVITRHGKVVKQWKM